MKNGIMPKAFSEADIASGPRAWNAGYVYQQIKNRPQQKSIDDRSKYQKPSEVNILSHILKDGPTSLRKADIRYSMSN